MAVIETIMGVRIAGKQAMTTDFSDRAEIAYKQA